MVITSPGYRYDTSYEPEGNQARVTGHFVREQTEAAIAFRSEFGLEFFGVGGNCRIAVQALTRHRQPQPMQLRGSRAARENIRQPQRRTLSRLASNVNRVGLSPDRFPFPDGPLLPPEPPTPPVPPGGGGGALLHAPVQVQLFAPGQAEAVQTWELPEEYAGTYRFLEYNPPGFPTPDAPRFRLGWWRVVVTPTGGEPVMVHLKASAFRARVPFLTRSISTRLFDHVFRVALEALVPSAVIDGHTLRVAIGSELAAMFGVSPTVTERDISPLVSWGRLQSLKISAVSGREAKTVAKAHGRPAAALQWIHDDDIALDIQVAFAETDFAAYGFDLFRLDGQLGRIFLCFNRTLGQMTPISILGLQLLDSFVDDVARFFSITDADASNFLNDHIETFLHSASYLICPYLRDTLSRALGQMAVLHEIWFAGDAWQCRYFNEPPLSSDHRPWHPVDNADLATNTSLHTLGAVRPSSQPDAGDGPVAPPPAPSDPLGVWPDEFLVAGGAALERLDRHQSIVVVMMENRSFDHMLGGLAAVAPRAGTSYDGPPSHASNASAGGFLNRVPVVKTRDLALGSQIAINLKHDFVPVQFQIGDGTADTEGSGGMAGFARDLATIHDSPQLAMTVNSERELPIYYKLADRFLVCNRWFAAHPGPTWPNRFAAIMGSIPELNNFPIDDPRIGFFKGRSIFDVLTDAGIDWRVFESDLSLSRVFDRFRLDEDHVVPIDDPAVGLDATLRSGRLPRVMFIEPNFTDIPPLATASDDLPPADLAAGQAFIARVCDAIWSAGKFDDCLMLITYDEHGGFYDHVPPPGTPKAPATTNPIPRLHADAPPYLGVRVPAMVISPYVNAGAVNDTVFDHTAILKSILVHNRASLPGSVLASFGARTNASAHLGQVLDRADPRADAGDPFDPLRRRPPSAGGAHPDVTNPELVLATDATLGSAAAPAPLPPRTVTIVPYTQPAEHPPETPHDFHLALRRMFTRR